MSENRKPVIVAIVIAAVLVVAFAVVAGFGGRGDDSGAGWTDFLGGTGGTSTLGPDDLRLVEGVCVMSTERIDVSGSCAFEVAGFGGGLAFGEVVKRATIAAIDSPVRLTVLVEGTTVSQSIEQGEPTQLTFGTSGGGLGLACLGFAVSTCSVSIGQ